MLIGKSILKVKMMISDILSLVAGLIIAYLILETLWSE